MAKKPGIKYASRNAGTMINTFGFRKKQLQGTHIMTHNVLMKIDPLLRPQKQKINNMTNKQYQRTKPSLWNRMQDTDRDGVPNWLDCRPFNKKKQSDEYQQEVRCTGYIPAGGTEPAYACEGQKPATWFKPSPTEPIGISHTYCPRCYQKAREAFGLEEDDDD